MTMLIDHKTVASERQERDVKPAWVATPYKDLWMIAPPFVVTAVALLFHTQLAAIEARYSWWTWLVLIVCVDVAHVYASIFKTYLIASERRRQAKLLWGIPALCLLLALLLYQAGYQVFWSVLAYVAVFHFVRQQWGLMRLYSRFEPKNRLGSAIDGFAIYSATLYPMLYWMINDNRVFNWFVADEFLPLHWAALMPVFSVLYGTSMLLFVLRVVWQGLRLRQWNVPKMAVVVGTYLSWYVGIVYFNHPLIFTLLNVVSHGVPYMALVYLTEVAAKQHSYSVIGRLCSWQGLLLYVAVLLGLAVVEESVWEVSIWGEHLVSVWVLDEAWWWLAVPLLALPQLTHYVLDGFIWRRPKTK